MKLIWERKESSLIGVHFAGSWFCCAPQCSPLCFLLWSTDSNTKEQATEGRFWQVYIWGLPMARSLIQKNGQGAQYFFVENQWYWQLIRLLMQLHCPVSHVVSKPVPICNPWSLWSLPSLQELYHIEVGTLAVHAGIHGHLVSRVTKQLIT